MSGSPSRFPTPPPGRGSIRWALPICAVLIAIPLILDPKSKKQAAPVAPPAPVRNAVPAPPAEPKQIFFAIATSFGTWSYAHAATRAEAETTALDECRAKKEKRFKGGAIVDQRDCEIRTTISNQPGFPSCVAFFTNSTNYMIAPHVMPGSDIDLYQRMRDFVSTNSYYQRKAQTVANLKNMMFCTEPDGTLYNRDVTYGLER